MNYGDKKLYKHFSITWKDMWLDFPTNSPTFHRNKMHIMATLVNSLSREAGILKAFKKNNFKEIKILFH